MKYKVVGLLLTLGLAFSLGACGFGGEDDDEEDEDETKIENTCQTFNA